MMTQFALRFVGRALVFLGRFVRGRLLPWGFCGALLRPHTKTNAKRLAMAIGTDINTMSDHAG